MQHALFPSRPNWPSLYAFIEPLAAGKFGTVYKARHLTQARTVAIKLVPRPRHDVPLPQLDRMLTAELRHWTLLTRRRVQGIPKLHDAYDDGVGHVGFVQDFIRGQPLDEASTLGTLRDAPILGRRVMSRLAEILQQMHAHGIVHGDVKPANVLVDLSKKNGAPRVHLVDFGSSFHLVGKEACGYSALPLFGTPAFAAPEVLSQQKLCFASDVWSLACLAHAVLHERDADAEVWKRCMDVDPRQRPSLPELMHAMRVT